MQYVCMFAYESGASRFEDVDVLLSSIDYAPPAPPVGLSFPEPASAYHFLTLPAGWDGDWHPSPRRQLVVMLAGEIGITTSGGESRRFGPGSVVLGEDLTGTGHRSQAVGADGAQLAIVQLPRLTDEVAADMPLVDAAG